MHLGGRDKTVFTANSMQFDNQFLLSDDIFFCVRLSYAVSSKTFCPDSVKLHGLYSQRPRSCMLQYNNRHKDGWPLEV